MQDHEMKSRGQKCQITEWGHIQGMPFMQLQLIIVVPLFYLREKTHQFFEIKVPRLVVDFTKYLLGKSELVVFPHSENENVKMKELILAKILRNKLKLM